MSAHQIDRVDRVEGRIETTDAAAASSRSAWQRPGFDVICLACEISAYAPDEGDPLF